MMELAYMPNLKFGDSSLAGSSPATCTIKFISLGKEKKGSYYYD